MPNIVENVNNFRHSFRGRPSYHELAFLHALTAAQMLNGVLPSANTLAAAAWSVGSTPCYVAACRDLLTANDVELFRAVRFGDLPLLEAARIARRRLQLIDGLKTASPEDYAAVRTAVGVDLIWDRAIAPGI